jgi:predicted aspartyl protease
MKVQIGNRKVSMLVDTGASLSLIEGKLFDKISAKSNKPINIKS